MVRQRVIDTFLFRDELEILSLRLATLNPYVTTFVLVEGGTTFSGIPKPFHYLENIKKFKEFNHKIIHVQIPQESMPSPHLSRWNVEHFQRNTIQYGLQIARARSGDYVMLSDVDEIPRPSSIGHLGCFGQTMYRHYLNTLDPKSWVGTVGYIFNPEDPVHPAQRRIERERQPFRPHAGWHFTNMDDPHVKLAAGSHDECDTIEHLTKCLLERKYPERYGYFPMPLTEEHFPKYMVEHQEMFSHLFYKGEGK